MPRKPGRDRWDPEEVLEYQKSLMWLVDLDWDRLDKLALTDGGKVKKLTHWKDRLVHWTYSPHGGVGKSVTAMHIAMTKQYCYLSATEKVGDLIHAFVSGDFKGVVLDLSRAVSAESKEFIKTLEVIETFKTVLFFLPNIKVCLLLVLIFLFLFLLIFLLTCRVFIFPKTVLNSLLI